MTWWSKVAYKRKQALASGVAPRLRVVSARRPGVCPWCARVFPVDASIARTSGVWGHASCAQARVDAVAAVEASPPARVGVSDASPAADGSMKARFVDVWAAESEGREA